jgi:hypothetical protein
MGGYEGVLVSDCLNTHDELTARQHKCYAHHLAKIAALRPGNPRLPGRHVPPDRQKLRRLPVALHPVSA